MNLSKIITRPADVLNRPSTALKESMQALKEADLELAVAREAYAMASKKRSDVLREINNKHGHGPLMYAGSLWVIVSRRGGLGVNYFLRAWH